MLSTSDRQGVDHLVRCNRRPPDAAELHIYEAHIERGVVNYESRIANESEQFIDDVGKPWFVGKEFRGQSMNIEGFNRDVTLGIYVGVEEASGWYVIDKFYATDLDEAVSVPHIKTGCLRIEGNFS